MVSTENVTLWDDEGTKAAAVVTDGSGVNRIAVDAVSSPISTQNVLYRTEYLLNGVSSSQNVNGSVTPVVFSFIPGVGETWYVKQLSLVMIDNLNQDHGEYGALGSALTNGVLVDVNSSGNVQQLMNLKINTDIATHMDIFHDFNGQEFMNNSGIKAILKFDIPIKLSGTSDYIRATVRDNLTGLTVQRMSVLLYKVI